MINIIRQVVFFVTILLLQVLVLQRVDLSINSYYLTLVLYPFIVFSLPIKYSSNLVIIIAFLLGILIDIFYNSPGVHTSACVFVAFLRSPLLSMIEPRSGYPTEPHSIVKHYGFIWLLKYYAPLIFAHLFFLFSVKEFTFYYLGRIILQTISSFPVSLFLITVFAYIFNPKI